MFCFGTVSGVVIDGCVVVVTLKTCDELGQSWDDEEAVGLMSWIVDDGRAISVILLWWE